MGRRDKKKRETRRGRGASYVEVKRVRGREVDTSGGGAAAASGTKRF